MCLCLSKRVNFVAGHCILINFVTFHLAFNFSDHIPIKSVEGLNCTLVVVRRQIRCQARGKQVGAPTLPSAVY
jgi:hypothetical protein